MTTPEQTEAAMGRHADAVWHVCLLRCARTSDAEDAFQDTFLKYLKRTEPFADEEHERAWLIRVALNTCADQYKRAYRNDGALPDTLHADGAFEPGGAMGDVLDALMRLPVDQRTALYLTAVQGYSADEVAQTMEVATGTVYSWVSRARAKLKEALS